MLRLKRGIFARPQQELASADLLAEMREKSSLVHGRRTVEDRWAGEDDPWLMEGPDDPDPAEVVGVFRAVLVAALVGAALWTLAAFAVAFLL
jgi:hypothetical protein